MVKDLVINLTDTPLNEVIKKIVPQTVWSWSRSKRIAGKTARISAKLVVTKASIRFVRSLTGNVAKANVAITARASGTARWGSIGPSLKIQAVLTNVTLTGRLDSSFRFVQFTPENKKVNIKVQIKILGRWITVFSALVAVNLNFLRQQIPLQNTYPVRIPSPVNRTIVLRVRNTSLSSRSGVLVAQGNVRP